MRHSHFIAIQQRAIFFTPDSYRICYDESSGRKNSTSTHEFFFVFFFFSLNSVIFYFQLMKDTQSVIENGLTVLNPLLIGALSCHLVPNFYGEFDAFSYLLILLGTIIR